MLPDIPIRLSNMMKAMETIIAPAIDPENNLAQEQATLMMGHLKLLVDQWDQAYLYERGTLKEMKALAERLMDISGDSLNTHADWQALKTAVESVPEQLPDTATEINTYTISIGSCIDNLIYACFEEGSGELQDSVTTVMLAYGEIQTMRERVWFQGTGLDPEQKSLASIDAMLKQEATA